MPERRAAANRPHWRRPLKVSSPRLTVVVATYNNRAVLERCLDHWERFAAALPIEVVVVADGCKDDTEALLESRSRTAWGERQLRWVRESNVHELRCTNRGFREAQGDLVLSWHDDMFVTSSLLARELLALFDARPELGLVSLSRGLICRPAPRPESWEQLFNWGRIESTIGGAPGNWINLVEVDAVMRPWVVRKACVEAVGPLDESFKLSEWDEADFCFRIRRGGWKVATYGYERLKYYRHLGSSTIGRTMSDAYKAQVLANGRLFWDRWHEMIDREHDRPRARWRRPAGVAGWAWTTRQAAKFAARRLGAR